MDKTNFIIYKDSKAIIDLLNDAQAGKLFKAIFEYVEDRTELKTDDGMLKIAFTQMKITLERDLVKYKKIVERNKENGKLGGRPKLKPNGKKNNPNNPSGLNENPKEPKKADSVIDNGIVSDIDTDKKDKKTSKKVYFSNNIINDLFIDYLQMRIKIKKPATEKAISLAISKLNKLESDKLRIEMLENSVLNNYQGLFLPNITTKDKPKIINDGRYGEH